MRIITGILGAVGVSRTEGSPPAVEEEPEVEVASFVVAVADAGRVAYGAEVVLVAGWSEKNGREFV